MPPEGGAAVSGVEINTAILNGYNSEKKVYGTTTGKYDAVGKVLKQMTAEELEKVEAGDEAAVGGDSRRREDIVELSADGKQMAAETRNSNLFDILSRDYPEITILAESQNGTHDVREIAAQLGKGIYLVVSQEFLERMKRSPEDYETCKSVLKETLQRLTSGENGGGVSQGAYLTGSEAFSWYVPEQSKENVGEIIAEAANKKGSNTINQVSEIGTQQSATDFKRAATVSYSTANHYSRMAKAGSKGEVRMVMSDAYRSINNLRMAAVFGEDKESMKARQAIRSLQKLLARGGKKIKKLEREEILDVRKKRAEKARKEKQVRQIKIEQKKMRSARKASDYRLIREGISEEYKILGVRNGRNDYKSEHLFGNFDSHISGVVDIGAGMTGVADFSAADVVVSSEMTF